MTDKAKLGAARLNLTLNDASLHIFQCLKLVFQKQLLLFIFSLVFLTVEYPIKYYFLIELVLSIKVCEAVVSHLVRVDGGHEAKKV